ncbi:tetratricopeptide repeat protein [Terrimonas alba]|uniref:tetratricopeptide repeat protein n=1 Tax=Terrimonas alba TaxID=3349636 RepID=UPI0035F245BB
MKKPQWITIGIAILLVIGIFLFGRTTPNKKNTVEATHTENDGHDHGNQAAISIDSILTLAKKQLNPAQVTRLSMLENSISRGDVKEQQLKVYHQLSHFWGDSMRLFAPYAWYEAEAARLENSEKTLTFAAHLFLDNLQQEQNPDLIKWEAGQAKDLFERSLKINPDNDSSKVGLGACYLFGNISTNPMEGLGKIMEVVNKDSTNIYAQMTLVKGSILSGQIDKAINRLSTVHRLQPDNIEAILMLAEVYERKGDKKIAADWYKKSLQYIKRPDVRTEIEKRITELGK